MIGFVRHDVNNISFVSESDKAERCWHAIQRDTSSIAICNWYFSPQASLDDIDSFTEEVVEMQKQFDYVIVAGDLNTHQISWLRFSREDTPRGCKLKHTCDTHGLKEKVRQPTRGLYLLDLVLTDLDAISVKFGAKIADHRSLIIQVSDSFEERQLGSRHVWHYRDANWHAMEFVLEKQIGMFWKKVPSTKSSVF